MESDISVFGSRFCEMNTVVDVSSPQTEKDERGNSFTSYLITVKTNDISFHFPRTSIRRRFSDFFWLRKRLQMNRPFNSSLPSIPRRRIFFRFHESVIKERQEGFERFLQVVTSTENLLSDPCLHLFLQSDLSIPEIEDYLNGDKEVPASRIITERRSAVSPKLSFGSSAELSDESTSSHHTVRNIVREKKSSSVLRSSASSIHSISDSRR